MYRRSALSNPLIPPLIGALFIFFSSILVCILLYRTQGMLIAQIDEVVRNYSSKAGIGVQYESFGYVTVILILFYLFSYVGIEGQFLIFSREIASNLGRTSLIFLFICFLAGIIGRFIERRYVRSRYLGHRYYHGNLSTLIYYLSFGLKIGLFYFFLILMSSVFGYISVSVFYFLGASIYASPVGMVRSSLIVTVLTSVGAAFYDYYGRRWY